MAQGTIKEFDEAGRTGSLLMDDRTEVFIDAASMADETIRTLRLGQRVKFDLADKDGTQVARQLKIVTFD